MAVAAGLVALGCLALASPVFGLLRPDLNWDLLAYVAIVKSWVLATPAELHRAAYADVQGFAAAHGFAAQYANLTGGSEYRRAVAADPVAFWQQLPFYRVRPLYVGLVAVAGRLTATVTAATMLVSALSVLGTNLIFAGAAVRRFGVLRAVLPVGLFCLAPFLIEVARDSTPDALLTLFVMAGFALLLRGRDLAAAALLFAAVLVRSDTALLDLLLALMLGGAMAVGLLPRRWPTVVLAAVLLLSVPVEQAVERAVGNYGYAVLHHVTFVGFTPYPAALRPDQLALTLGGVVRPIVGGLYDTMAAGTLWAVAGLALLAGGLLGARPAGRPGVALVAVAAWVAVRFVLFPSHDMRLLTPPFAVLCLLPVAVWPVRGVRGDARA